ncbi:hypothetical protein D3C81_2335070 [compost metagenome]
MSVPADAESLTAAGLPPGYEDAMVTVWENGQLLQDDTLAAIRSRANAARL